MTKPSAPDPMSPDPTSPAPVSPDTLYSRRGCHLCEQAEAALTAFGWPFVRAEISGDDALEARYGWDVPVLVRAVGAAGERVLAKGVIGAARLERVRAEWGPPGA